MSNEIPNKEIHEKAIKQYGKLLQIDIAIEEMSELTQILCKIKRINHLDTSIPMNQIQYFSVITELKPKLIEEIVDVSLMLDSLRVLYDSDSKLYSKIKEEKVIRLLNRIKGNKGVNKNV